MMFYLLNAIISILVVGSVHDNLSIHCSVEETFVTVKKNEEQTYYCHVFSGSLNFHNVPMINLFNFLLKAKIA